MNLRALAVLTALSLSLAACVGDDKADGTDSNATTSSETTGGTTAGTGTDGTAGTASTTTAGTAGSGSDSASSTSAGTTMDSGTTAGTTAGTTVGTTAGTTAGTTDGTTGGGGIPESCDKACEVVFGCFPDDFASKDECIAVCIDESTPTEPNDACEAAVIALNECIATLTCMDLSKPDAEVCVEEDAAVNEACGGGDVCSIGVGGDAMSCGISEECPDSSRALECEGDVCRCVEDGVEVAKCDNGVCADDINFDALTKKALECCGWQF